MQPGVASVHCAILQKSPGSVSFQLRNFKELGGKSFRDVRRRFTNAIICGIFRAKGNVPMLNAGDDEIVQEDDQDIA